MFKSQAVKTDLFVSDSDLPVILIRGSLITVGFAIGDLDKASVASVLVRLWDGGSVRWVLSLFLFPLALCWLSFAGTVGVLMFRTQRSAELGGLLDTMSSTWFQM